MSLKAVDLESEQCRCQDGRIQKACRLLRHCTTAMTTFESCCSQGGSTGEIHAIHGENKQPRRAVGVEFDMTREMKIFLDGYSLICKLLIQGIGDAPEKESCRKRPSLDTKNHLLAASFSGGLPFDPI